MAVIAQPLADGQLPAAIGTLYTSTSEEFVTEILLLNTGATTETVKLYFDVSGTDRQVFQADLSAGFSLVFAQNISLELFDKVRGETTNAATVDYVVFGAKEKEVGLVDAKPLADGQIAAAATAVYTSAVLTAFVSEILLFNTGATTETVKIYIDATGTNRQIFQADLQQYYSLLYAENISLSSGDKLLLETTNAATVDYVVFGAERST